MCEKNELKKDAIPDAEENKVMGNQSVTTPKEDTEIFIPVKFNKEVKNLTLEEASDLAQKGLKFNAISKEYEQLRSMAAESKKSVAKFLEEIKDEKCAERLKGLTEKCGGDEDLAKHILELEKGKATDSAFSEVMEFFPEISSAEQLPEQVLENAELSGRGLLDEYLRYLLKEKRLREEAEKNQRLAERTSSGSQLDRAGGISPETAEFLKGLWN